jgi:hypothetical protein
MNAPGTVEPRPLRELHIELRLPKKLQEAECVRACAGMFSAFQPDTGWRFYRICFVSRPLKQISTPAGLDRASAVNLPTAEYRFRSREAGKSLLALCFYSDTFSC